MSPKAFARAIVMVELAVIAAALTLIVGDILTRDPPYRPFREFESPQRIVGTRVIAAGNVVSVKGRKCYDVSLDVVPITGTAWWARVDGPAPRQRILYPAGTGRLIRVPALLPGGCLVTTYRNRVPKGLPAGRWRLEGIETAAKDGTVGWYTQTFTVCRPGDRRCLTQT